MMVEMHAGVQQLLYFSSCEGEYVNIMPIVEDVSQVLVGVVLAVSHRLVAQSWKAVKQGKIVHSMTGKGDMGRSSLRRTLTWKCRRPGNRTYG